MVRNFANATRTVRGGTTESRGSVDVVRTAMTTGEVEATSDVTKIKNETQELKEVTETQKSKEGDELHETKEEHTQEEIGGTMRLSMGNVS